MLQASFNQLDDGIGHFLYKNFKSIFKQIDFTSFH